MHIESFTQSAETPGRQEARGKTLVPETPSPLGDAFFHMMILFVVVAYYLIVWVLKALSRDSRTAPAAGQALKDDWNTVVPERMPN